MSVTRFGRADERSGRGQEWRTRSNRSTVQIKVKLCCPTSDDIDGETAKLMKANPVGGIINPISVVGRAVEEWRGAATSVAIGEFSFSLPLLSIRDTSRFFMNV